jgi:hypothetical protein
MIHTLFESNHIAQEQLVLLINLTTLKDEVCRLSPSLIS